MPCILKQSLPCKHTRKCATFVTAPFKITKLNRQKNAGTIGQALNAKYYGFHRSVTKTIPRASTP